MVSELGSEALADACDQRLVDILERQLSLLPGTASLRFATVAEVPPELALERLEEARRASAELVRHTPVLTAASLSSRCGGTVVLKAENLQRTGSFKLRGALNKVRAVGQSVAGVVAGSAGNHAQALAYAARAAGLPCFVFMPEDAAVSKVEAVRAFGASVEQRGGSVVECVGLAREHASAEGLAFVHPFDDLDVICGQAGLGLELLDDVPDLARVVVPVGGGGLASGVAAAVRARRPGVAVVGVRAETSAGTIADGIAIKHPGEVTGPLLDSLLDEMVSVGEDDIAETMVLLVERSKLVVEGAGAVSLAALLSGAVEASADGSTVAVLSGGNVDVGLLAAIATRHETRVGRRLRVYTRVSDLPGGLAGLLAAVASAGANLIHVEHVREGVDLGVRETGVELTVETRGRSHARELLAALREAGYEPAEVGG
ncbi:MAG: threonine dehydratase [Thermoleophilaceae bacterium]|nr:threonine dehydratase [Thermoleophilaceae bacterium]